LNTARAHQHFELGDALAVQLPGFKAGDQLLDFFLLGPYRLQELPR
jgi:hypothetical protein